MILKYRLKKQKDNILYHYYRFQILTYKMGFKGLIFMILNQNFIKHKFKKLKIMDNL
jgi:hypothetical protein